MPREGAQRMVEITDAGAVIAAAKWVLSSKREGETWPDFEARLGEDLSRPTLERLKQGLGGAGKPLTRVRESTAFAIARLLEEAGESELHRRLANALIPPQATDLTKDHVAWLREQFARYLYRPASPVFMVESEEPGMSTLVWADDPLIESLLNDAGVAHDEELDEELTGIALYRWAEYRNLLRAVLNDVEARKALNEFQEFCVQHGHEERYSLARFRILEPLLQAPESGAVEPGWRELSPTQLRRFVRAGIARERIFIEIGAQQFQRVQATALHGTVALPLWTRSKSGRRTRRLHFRR